MYVLGTLIAIDDWLRAFVTSYKTIICVCGHRRTASYSDYSTKLKKKTFWIVTMILSVPMTLLLA